MKKFFTYVLKSQKNRFIYIGSTANVEKRVWQHNAGKVRSTKAYRPWKLLEYHSFASRSEAVIHEHFLKQHQQKERLQIRYSDQ